MDQLPLFDDTEYLPLFAQCPATVEEDPFETMTDEEYEAHIERLESLSED